MSNLLKAFFILMLPVVSQASVFDGEWTCTINDEAALELKIESTFSQKNDPALRITPALSLAHNHKGLLVLDSEKITEQKDYFEDDDNSQNGLYNYIRTVEKVTYSESKLEISFLETYLRSDVNNGVESVEILQNKDHEVMQFEIQAPNNMVIREYSARGKTATPHLITVRHCIRK